jgi:hypothetical protein
MQSVSFGLADEVEDLVPGEWVAVLIPDLYEHPNPEARDRPIGLPPVDQAGIAVALSSPGNQTPLKLPREAGLAAVAEDDVPDAVHSFAISKKSGDINSYSFYNLDLIKKTAGDHLMDKGAYCDGLMDLMTQVYEVTFAELEAMHVRRSCSHMFDKGVGFEDAFRALESKFGEAEEARERS